MDDKQIIALYFQRSETAIAKTAEKYGKYCHTVAFNILQNQQDSEECVNETWFRAWNTIPPRKPNRLSTYLGKITRNLALDKYKYYNRDKRIAGQTALALDELDECIPTVRDTEQILNDKELAAMLNAFLGNLPARKRQVFVRRYWYLSTISDIAKDYGMSVSHVKVMLLRTRNELKQYLEQEGVVL